MDTNAQVKQLLDHVQQREKLNDSALAKHIGVSRWTLYRIREGEMGETISTKVLDFVVRELPRAHQEHTSTYSGVALTE